MAGTDAIRDGNHVPVALGVLSTDATATAPFKVNGSGQLLVVGATSGTVTSVSVVTANGFAGSVATATTTPAITISTTVTGLLQGNGTSVSAATSFTLSALSKINANATALPTAQTGTLLQIGQVDGTAPRIELDPYGASGFYTVVRRSGTAASPSQVLAGEQVGGFNGMGYTDAAAVTGPIASFRIYALQNLTSSAQGSIASIAAIPSGSTTMADQLTVYGSTGVGIGLASATTVPDAKLHVISTTSPQLRVGYDTSNYMSISVASDGDVALNGAGTDGDWTITSGDSLTINGTGGFTAQRNGTTIFTLGSGTAGVQASSGSGWSLPSASSSSTQPTLVPNRASVTTGIGAQASGNVSMIIGGAERERWGILSQAAWTTSGVNIRRTAQTYNDTTSSGTVATAYTDLFGVSTITSTSAATYTNYIGTFFADPVASTNVTMTNKWALGADSIYAGGGAFLVSSAGALTAPSWTSGSGGFTINSSGGTPNIAVPATATSRIAWSGGGSVLSSGTVNFFTVTPTVTQTGTAGYTSFLVNQTETSTGSGTKLLLDLQVGSSSQFRVTNGGNVTCGGITAGASNGIGWSGRGAIAATADGVFKMSNNADTDFGRLMFGGTTSSFPAIKRSSAALAVRLADDSADASITAASVTASGNVVASGATSVVRLKGYTVGTLPAGTQGDTAFVTDALAPAFLTIIVAGGSAVTPVFYNGTNWVAM